MRVALSLNAYYSCCLILKLKLSTSFLLAYRSQYFDLFLLQLLMILMTYDVGGRDTNDYVAIL